MYVLFRDDMISSDEIAKEIESSSDFRVETDLSKATKREDVMSFKLSIDVCKLTDKEFSWEDDELVDECFQKAESMTKDFLKFFPKYTVQASEAYKWDDIENRIHLVVVIANIDITLKKLQLDILKRMMKQVD